MKGDEQGGVSDGLPDFVVPGFSRSGTTWLYSVLKSHPQIFLPRHKELHYFDRNLGRGPDWYRAHFADAADGQISGELTPTYTEIPGLAPDLVGFLPHAKVVIVLRNPMGRLPSVHRQLLRDGRTSLDLVSWIESGFLNEDAEGRDHRYAPRIREYMDLVPPERLLIKVYEDLKRDREAYLGSVLSFLGVDPSGPLPPLEGRVNPTVAPSSMRLHRILGPMNRFLRRRKSKTIDACLTWFRDGYRRSLSRPLTSVPLSEAEKEAIRGHCSADVEEVSGLLGRDLAGEWGFQGEGEG